MSAICSTSDSYRHRSCHTLRHVLLLFITQHIMLVRKNNFFCVHQWYCSAYYSFNNWRRVKLTTVSLGITSLCQPRLFIFNLLWLMVNIAIIGYCYHEAVDQQHSQESFDGWNESFALCILTEMHIVKVLPSCQWIFQSTRKEDELC